MGEEPLRAPNRTAERIFWSGLALATTALLVFYQERIGAAHVALIYLLIVLGASARGGRRLGLGLALLCFLAFNFFFLSPYRTFAIHNRLDWLVLLAFLLTSAVATQLLHKAQAQAEAARQRALEIDRLATLGAETLNAGRAEDAAAAIARVVQAGLDVAGCEIYLRDEGTGKMRCVARAVRGGRPDSLPGGPDPRLLDHAAEGLATAQLADGTSFAPSGGEDAPPVSFLLRGDARALYIPLRVQERRVGVLRLENPDSVVLDAAQQRFADALAYYAALALERIQLTETAEHAQALREADRLKDVLLASVSHDLRTPLTSIKALAHDMASDGDERATVVEQEVDRLNHYVSDLLELSRLNAETHPLTTELIAVEDVLGAALQQVAGVQNGIGLNASLDSSGPLLVGRFDFVHTLRALVNLIDNALKYSPADAAVDVTARRDGDWIVFSVADRGRGIPPAERGQIFEPFVRGSGAQGVRGTGMGLAIARRAAELQGGSVDHGPRPGGGSVFSLRLPAAAADELERMSL